MVDFLGQFLTVNVWNQGCGVGGKMSNSDSYLSNFSDSALFKLCDSLTQCFPTEVPFTILKGAASSCVFQYIIKKYIFQMSSNLEASCYELFSSVGYRKPKKVGKHCFNITWMKFACQQRQRGELKLFINKHFGLMSLDTWVKALIRSIYL